MKEIIATDIDGVLAENEHDVADYRPWRLHKWYKLCKPTERCKKHYDYVITGRRIHFRKVTEYWLKENNVTYNELVMFPNKVPKTNKTLRIYKAEVINDFGVDKFYEDDERIFDFIKSECPDVEIILIESEK